jgi:hypothetical protein
MDNPEAAADAAPFRAYYQSPFDQIVAINYSIILHLPTSIIRRSRRLLNVDDSMQL